MSDATATIVVWGTMGVYGAIMGLIAVYFIKKIFKKRAKPRGELVRMSDYRHTRNK